MHSEGKPRTTGAKDSCGWIELGIDGSPVGSENLAYGIYLVEVLKGLRVKSTQLIVLHWTSHGWRRPDGRHHVGSAELKQRCQWIGDLPAESASAAERLDSRQRS